MLLVVASIVIGTRTIALSALVDMVNGVDIDAADAAVIQDLRIPRTILGIVVGAALGTAGTLIQGHTRNPLADPGIFGINAGAAFAVVVSFTFCRLPVLPVPLLRRLWVPLSLPSWCFRLVALTR